LSAGPSHFSPEITTSVTSSAAFAKPFHLCSDVQNKQEVSGKIAIVERGDCTFVDKARRAMNAGAKAVIIFDNVPDTSIDNQPPFGKSKLELFVRSSSNSFLNSQTAMSGDGKDDVNIQTSFLFMREADKLKNALKLNSDLEVSLDSTS